MAIIEIVPNGDVNVEVNVIENLQNGNEKKKSIKETATFKVHSTAIAVGAFEKFLTWAQTTGQIKIEDGSIASMEVLFQCLHKQKPRVDISLKDVWHVITAIGEYLLNIKEFEDWYVAWYKHQPIQTWFRDWIPGKRLYQDKNKDPRCLLYPTWRFDYAEDFLEITAFLVYKSVSAVTEANPVRAWELRMPSRIIQQLNAARGRLKTIVFYPLYAPIKSLLLHNDCKCAEGVAAGYQRALLATDSWPLEEIGHKKAMRALLDNLQKFKYKKPESACMSCHRNYEAIVKEVIVRTRNYFDGLCLDCMDASKAKTEDSDTDYWCHNDLTEDEFVYGCRVKRHGQPTWYFSFMGRKEEQDRFRKEIYETKKEERRDHGIY